MKKTIILFVLILLSLVSIAQIKYGLRAGMTLSSYNLAQSVYQFKPGIHIGGVADIPLGSSEFSFVPGVYFADKGTKTKGHFPPENVDFVLPVDKYFFEGTDYKYQLEIPLLFTYKIKINEKSSLKPQIGVYLSYGILGISKEKRYYDEGAVSSGCPTEFTYYSHFYDKNGSFWGYGGNIGLSIFYNKFSYTFSCDVGYLDYIVRPTEYPDICMFFSLGYNF